MRINNFTLLLAAVILVLYWLYQILAMVFDILATAAKWFFELVWGILTLAIELLMQHFLYVLGAATALTAWRVIARRRARAQLKRAIPDVHTFVHSYLTEVIDPLSPQVPEEDLEAFQEILRQKGIDLDAASLRAAVLQEFDARLKERRVRDRERSIPEIRLFVSAYLSGSCAPFSPTLPEADLEALQSTLHKRQVSLDLSTIKEMVQRELDQQVAEVQVRNLKRATPDIQAFVSAHLTETSESPDVTEAELKALQATLWGKGIMLEFATIHQAVQGDLHRQVEENRVRNLESAVPEIRTAVGAYFGRDRWPDTLDLPVERLNELHAALIDRRIYIDFRDLQKRVVLELNCYANERVERTLRDRYGRKRPRELDEWAKAYVDIFGENDEYIAFVTNAMQEGDIRSSQSDLTRAIAALRQQSAHSKRVEAISKAMARQIR